MWWTGGEPVAGDDAAEAVFVSVEEAVRRVDWDETRRIIALAAVMAESDVVSPDSVA